MDLTNDSNIKKHKKKRGLYKICFIHLYEEKCNCDRFYLCGRVKILTEKFEAGIMFKKIKSKGAEKYILRPTFSDLVNKFESL